ncbi:MAG TPA: Rrf2 family transcriptional regulator [Planctomycetota bacterium]|nr:Rrf2 family transcriptional regulator [Planctomycetota bacterium]
MAASTRFAVAVHVLVALAYLGEQGATSEELARSVNTNAVVVRRLLGALAKAGLVSGRGGRSGGYTLARAPGRITLELVFKAIEPEGVLALHENPTNRACEVSCQIKGLLGTVFDGAQRAFEQRLRRTSIADLVGQTRART